MDLNRNFYTGPVREDEIATDPCRDNFGGKFPFSEPETIALKNYITGINLRVEYYISFHAFGQMLMFPFGFTKERCKDHAILDRKAKIGADAIK